MNSKGDELIGRLIEGRDDKAAHALLEELYHGYPVERLRLLLRSQREDAVRAGAWIASELGAQANPLLEDMVELLAHGTRYVKFFLLDAVLAASTVQDGRAIASAVELIGDKDDAVRWKVMNFLARATTEQLAAAEPYLADNHVRLTAWLIDTERTANTATITSHLASTDSLSRLVAAAAAARLAANDDTALECATRSNDPEVRSFALERFDKPK